MPGGPRKPKGALMPGGGGPRKPNGGGPGILMKGRHLMRGKKRGPGGRNPPLKPPLPLTICKEDQNNNYGNIYIILRVHYLYYTGRPVGTKTTN